MANLPLICGVAYAGHVIVSIRTPRGERHRYELALPVPSPQRPKKYWPQSPDQRNVHRMVLICVTFRTSSGMGSIPNNVALQSVVKAPLHSIPAKFCASPRSSLEWPTSIQRFADRCVWHRPRATGPIGIHHSARCRTLRAGGCHLSTEPDEGEGAPPIVESRRRRRTHATPVSLSQQGRHPPHRGELSASRNAGSR